MGRLSAAACALLVPSLAYGQATGVLTPGAPKIIEPVGECRAAGQPYACCTGRDTGTCTISDLACAATKNGDCTGAATAGYNDNRRETVCTAVSGTPVIDVARILSEFANIRNSP